MSAGPPRQDRLTRPDGRHIDYAVCGAGPTDVILIHGWACHQGFWRHQTGPLSRHARVATLDLAGHGASTPLGPTQTVSMAALAQDVVAVADALALDDVILVGHSMGGPIAVEAAISMPCRCRLVLGVDTFTDAAFYAKRPPNEIMARRQMFAADFAGTLSAMVRKITATGGPDATHWIVREACRTDPASALPVLQALLEWDAAARWPALPCPVETINSEILARGIETVPGLSGLRILMMQGVGHFPMLEDPDGFTALVRDIIRRRPPPSGSS